MLINGIEMQNLILHGIKIFFGLVLSLPVFATSLEIGELNQGKYGFNYFGKKNKIESFNFIPSSSKLTVQFDTYGISHKREVKLYVNNKFIRYLNIQGIVASGSESLTIKQLYPGKINTIKFRLGRPTDRVYGITNLILSPTKTSKAEKTSQEPTAATQVATDTNLFLRALETSDSKITSKEATKPKLNGPIGHWPFDGNAEDVSGNQNHGKQYNNPYFPTGYINRGLDANGAYISVNSDSFDVSKFTLMAWIKPDNVAGTYRVIIEKDRWKSDWYGLYQVGNKIHVRWSLSGTTTATSIALAPNVFSHVAGTFDGSSARIYINGVLKHTLSGSPSKPSKAKGELRFGITGDGTEAYQGIIDEAKIFGGALNQSEIQLAMDSSSTATDNKSDSVLTPSEVPVTELTRAATQVDRENNSALTPLETRTVETPAEETTTANQVEVSNTSSGQSSAEIKLYNPPADVAEFKGKDLYYSNTLSTFGIAKAGKNTLRSARYKMEVKPKGTPDSEYKQVFTYQSLNNLIQDSRYEGHRWSRKDMTDANHWGSFDFKGEITVKVTPVSQQISGVSISPKSKNYPFTFNNGAIVLDLSEAQLDAKNLDSHKIALKFSGSDALKHPLFIFANKFETDVPSTNSKNIKLFEPGTHAAGTYSQPVLYFKPGLHTVSGTGRITISSNTTVYLAGGAYVMGQFYSVSQSNINIHGRGILSGVNRDHDPYGGWADAPHLIEHWGGDGSTFSVKGITLTDTAKSNIHFDGNNATVSNVKLFSWRPNSDGVTLRQNSSIRDSFFKIFDDTVKLFHSNSKAEEIIIWQQPSGAAFQLGWNTSWVSAHGYVNNIDVINSDFTLEKEREGDKNLNNAIISIRNFRKGTGKIDDFQFNNIRIEGRPYQILDLGTVDGLVSGFAGSDSIGGSVQNLVLRNMTSEGFPRIPSYIKEEGPKGNVGPVTFENVRINGGKLTGIEHQGRTAVRVYGGAMPIFK